MLILGHGGLGYRPNRSIIGRGGDDDDTDDDNQLVSYKEPKKEQITKSDYSMLQQLSGLKKLGLDEKEYNDMLFTLRHVPEPIIQSEEVPELFKNIESMMLQNKKKASDEERYMKSKIFNMFKDIHTSRQAKEFNNLELEMSRHTSKSLTLLQNEFNARKKHYTRNILKANNIGELRLATIDYINKIGEENDMGILKETNDKLFGYYDYKNGDVKGLMHEPNAEKFKTFINSIIEPIEYKIRESSDVNVINNLYLKKYFVQSYLEFDGMKKLIDNSNMSASKKENKINILKRQLQQLYQVVDGVPTRVYSRIDYENEMSNIKAPNSGVRFEIWVVTNKDDVLHDLGHSGTLAINSDVKGFDKKIDVGNVKLKLKDLTAYDINGSDVGIECKYYTTYSEGSLTREHNGMFPLQRTKFLGNDTFKIYFIKDNGQMKLYGMLCVDNDNKGWFPGVGAKDYYLLTMGESFMYKYKLNINDESLYDRSNGINGINGEELYNYNFGKIAQKFKVLPVEFHGKKSPCIMIPFNKFEKVIIRK